MKLKWPWFQSEPAPEPDRPTETLLRKAAETLLDREFAAEQSVMFQNMRGLTENRIRIVRPDGTWLAELIECVDGIYRVRLEPFDG